MSADERIDRARLTYERAFFGGNASGLAIAERELDGVEADLALARGRIIHTRFFEEQTARIHRSWCCSSVQLSSIRCSGMREARLSRCSASASFTRLSRVTTMLRLRL